MKIKHPPNHSGPGLVARMPSTMTQQQRIDTLTMLITSAANAEADKEHKGMSAWTYRMHHDRWAAEHASRNKKLIITPESTLVQPDSKLVQPPTILVSKFA